MVVVVGERAIYKGNFTFATEGAYLEEKCILGVGVLFSEFYSTYEVTRAL